ncbi:ATP-dependent DNA helicase PIF1-like [Microplitis demolitor]|uniref:ATP-dependent DNA helicase PIF1-like n=1 Tax=Microplitis demolitor TaxID=69319 RepID=UPI00235B6E34|nr:ATP-dependent DNA helicase PIF1-like [Microplitis demolitor]
MNQDTIVTAPTVEHGFTPAYKQLSDNALKVLRDQLKDVTLFIIDEISMISNITLIYIHLRLVEIFNVDDWFGGRHVVVFGDLLQLPPVHEDPSYMTLSSADAQKYIRSLTSVNLWSDLFSYEELAINMRQKTDKVYSELLSRVRVSSMTFDDIKLLEQRKITIDSSLSYYDRLQKASDYIDCPESLKKKAHDTLVKIEEDASRSAGLAGTIVIKIGAKVMLRRNIDVTLGLVNGAIGTVISIPKSIDGRKIHGVNLDFGSGKVNTIERAKVKFQLLERAFVIRKQFPLCLSYAVTIHKSQGLSLKNALIEAGNSIFNVGQTYVALSRVTELEGLHLINFDPHSVKSNLLAIEEFNRLRKIYRSDLSPISISTILWHKIWDLIWVVDENSVEIETKTLKKSCEKLLVFRGIESSDCISSGLNSIIQCIFDNTILRTALNHDPNNQFNNENLNNLFNVYNSHENILKSSDIKKSVYKQACPNRESDPVAIFTTICNDNHDIRNLVQFEQKTLCVFQ